MKGWTKLYRIKMFVTTHGKIISISDLGCTNAPKNYRASKLVQLNADST